jgi:hypothetical protein
LIKRVQRWSFFPSGTARWGITVNGPDGSQAANGHLGHISNDPAVFDRVKGLALAKEILADEAARLAQGNKTFGKDPATSPYGWRFNATRRAHMAQRMERWVLKIAVSYSVAFLRKSCRAEKNRTTPRKGINTHPAFASGTTGICLSFPLPLFSPSLPFPLSCPAYASAGRIKVTATRAQTFRKWIWEEIIVNIIWRNYAEKI